MDINSEIGIHDPNAAACSAKLSYDMASVLSILASVLGILWMGYNLFMLRRINLET